MIDNDWSLDYMDDDCGCQMHIETPCGCEMHEGLWITARCDHGRIWMQGDQYLIECDDDLTVILGETKYRLVRVSGRGDHYDRD